MPSEEAHRFAAASLPRVIGLCSPAQQSGKDTAAEYLVRTYGYTRIKFAGCLKEMLKALFVDLGYMTLTVNRLLEGDLKEVPVDQIGKTPRYLMETLGTDWGRKAVGDTLWADLWTFKAEAELRKFGGRVVVDDLRFPNEAEAVKDLGGRVVQVYHPDAVPNDWEEARWRVLQKAVKFDHIVTNDSSIADLHARLDRYLGVEA